MKLVLVTGLSGSGKGVALKTLEDCGFEAIDNIPLAFLPAVVGSTERMRHLAVGTDVRSRDFSLKRFMEAIAALKSNPSLDFHMVYMDCDDEVLQRRYTETRRRHPLALDRPVLDGIRHERGLLGELRDAADLVFDTTALEVAELRRMVIRHLASDERHLSIVLTSFSYKKGVPREADLVFDARFLRNPHYDSALQPLTGMDPQVGQHIEQDKDFASFYAHLVQLMLPLLPRFLEEGKSYLTIAFGCTGGKHRSVYLAQKFAGDLERSGYSVTVRHRDLNAT